MRFQPWAAGSKGRRAIPTMRPTSRERSSERMKARPISPVGPVTATVRPAISRPGVASAGSATRCGRSTQTPRSSSRSPSTWKPRRPGASAHRQARPGSIGAPTGSASTSTTPASRSAATGTRTAKGKPSGPTKASTASGGGAERVEALVPHDPAALGRRVADLGLLVVRRADLVDVRVVEPRLGLEVAAGPDVDALGQHVDVELSPPRSSACAVPCTRTIASASEKSSATRRVGLHARDGDVDAALRPPCSAASAATPTGWPRASIVT